MRFLTSFALSSFCMQVSQVTAFRGTEHPIRPAKTSMSSCRSETRFIAPQDSMIPARFNSPKCFNVANFDKGIYLPTYADGKSMCAAIMSYNFTPGENPELKERDHMHAGPAEQRLSHR